ncbi:hypothetical protein E8E13_001319 [Curvularia kusanoi]|uniref:Heterokaryon incompatibility domain-containing protein n=1 Tax=Curvularia kusanoi TaxID=90978 RepID=A0A9P4THN3_CURKU|nr:hypothetical protein E8E13_001319 [Curvularia kusanoi]
MAENLNIELQNADVPENPSTIYRPLKANHIRVLLILPATEPDFSDTISCQLSEESLDSDPLPKYRALSYVWGNTSNPKTVLLNGQPFPVRNNLWTFLAQARKHGYTDPAWIDAVCINQDDTDERNKQVALMGRVYCSATDVRVWLEDEDGEIERTVEEMDNLGWPENVAHFRFIEEGQEMIWNWNSSWLPALRFRLGNMSIERKR